REGAGVQLPESDRDECRRDERAAERQPRPPPPASAAGNRGRELTMLRFLDAPDDTRPETRPVGLGALAGAQGALDEGPHSPDILGLTLTGGALAQVSGDRRGGAMFLGHGADSAHTEAGDVGSLT